ncbi:MAG: uracil-DNA glycosylase [Clostridiales bacterium]|nr:uracil-DNA glycosylase [Clostridiales bacterium]
MEKYNRLNKLYREYENKFSNEELVMGDGDVNCSLLMIGEAPGKDEVIQKKPFVGLAGGKLKEFIDYLNKTRQDFYVTNAIKYRLYKINSLTNRKSNRPAKVNEIKESRDTLLQEITIIKPAVVITLGAVPLKSVLGINQLAMKDYHGKAIKKEQYILFPLYHPASLIYNRDLLPVYYEDLDRLNKLIKEVTK